MRRPCLDEQGFKDNKPKMVDDYVQTTQEKKKYKTLKDMKTRDRDEYLTAEWNRYANKSRNLKRMAETDHWTDLSSKLTLFDEEVEVPLAARQADAVKERVKKGNTIITNVYGEALWKGQQAFQNKPGKLNCNHIISICGAVYDQSGNVIQGFLVKDTGGIGRKLPDGSLVEDADGDICGNYDFVDAYTLALAIKGDQSHKVYSIEKRR